MKAVKIEAFGDYDQLKVVDIPKPEVEPGKLHVKMLYAGVNPGDMDVAHGYIPFVKKPPLILGTEGCGIVEVGNDEFPAGTVVIIPEKRMGKVEDGTWREYLNVEPDIVYRLPGGLSPSEGAVLSVTYNTAQAGIHQAKFQAGYPTLITAMGGGVGNAAYQLALLQGAAPLIGTVGSPEKKRLAQRFITDLFDRPIVWKNVVKTGISSDKIHKMAEEYAEHVIDLSTENLEERVKKIVGDQGVRYVIDSIGSEYLSRAINLCGMDGVVISIGYKAGLQSEINIMSMLIGQIHMFGVNLYALPEDVRQASRNQVIDLVVKHRIRPTIAKTFDMVDAVKANQFLAEQRPFGKVVLRIAH